MAGYFRVKIDGHEAIADSIKEAKIRAKEIIEDKSISPSSLVNIVYTEERSVYGLLVMDLLREQA